MLVVRCGIATIGAKSLSPPMTSPQFLLDARAHFCLLALFPLLSSAAPIAVPDGYESEEDAPLIVDAAGGVLSNDTPDASPPTAVLESDVSNGTLALAPDGSFTYTPNENFIVAQVDVTANGGDIMIDMVQPGAATTADAGGNFSQLGPEPTIPLRCCVSLAWHPSQAISWSSRYRRCPGSHTYCRLLPTARRGRRCKAAGGLRPLRWRSSM